MGSLLIRDVENGGRWRDFLDVVDLIYKDDPHYVRPLDFDVRERLSLKHPHFAHASRRIFTAHKNGQCVGRIVAHRNDLHEARYKDGVGFFGFFDTIDDADVCSALLETAEDWLKAQGCTAIRGPITLSMAEEVGCLVEGFESSPMLLMGHHRPYQAGLIEKAGLVRVKDTFAWRYEVSNMPLRVAKAHASIAAMPEVRSRPVETKTFDEDVHNMLQIYNDAWQDSWGYVPLTPAEAAKVAGELRLFADLELTRLVEVDGVPSAFAYALPNINEALVGLNGRLLPWGLPKLVWRLKVQRPVTARLIGLGIAKRLRNVRQYAGLSAFLYSELNSSGQKRGYRWGELSYTLEDNGPVNTAIRVLGAQVYKRYRVFEKPVGSAALGNTASNNAAAPHAPKV